MSEAKTYVFGNEGYGNNLVGLLAPFLLNRGIDPNYLIGMLGNNGGFGGNQGLWFIWIIFIVLLWGRNGFGFGNGEGNGQLANMLNNDTGRELIMSAVQGNGQAISQLAATLNCDVNAIQTALGGINTAICQVGNQVGLTSQQIISSIQQNSMSLMQQLSTCCCDLKTQIASCCCDVKDSITRGNYENQIATLNQTNTLQNSLNTVNTGLERGFSQVGYATAQQTCDIKGAISDGIQKVVDGQKAAEMREMAGIINKQNDELSSYKTAGIIAQQLTPISGALAALRSEVDAIKCALPATVTLPYSCATAVPTTALYNGYGLCGNNFYGFNNAF